MQDTLSSRAALGLPAACLALRPSASREQRYLAYNILKIRMNFNTLGFLAESAFRSSTRSSKGFLHIRFNGFVA